LVGTIAKVVEATFSVGEESARSCAHAVAIGAFDYAAGSREGSSADGVVLGSSPETEDDEIGMMILPPFFISNLGWRGPEDWLFRNF
jgi:hypothetical protein